MPEITRNSCCDWWKTGRFLLHNGFLLRNMLIGGVKARTWGSIRAPRWKNLYSLQGLWSNQFRMDERVNWSGKGFASVGRILFFLDRVLDCLTNRLYIFFNNFHCKLFDKLLFNWIIHKQVLLNSSILI